MIKHNRVATIVSHNQVSHKRVCLVVGAGDATGGAIARRFNREGYVVACARRDGEKLKVLIDSLSSECRGFSTDARKEEDVVRLFETVEQEMGPIEVCVHNIGGNVRFPILETTERVYRKVWELVGLSAFLTARQAAKYMKARGRGTIIFTGATASIRGAANYSAFAGGMHAKRALAQSMARELGPENIHVAHVVIDGPIETEFVKGIVGHELFEEMLKNENLLSPDQIAEAYVQLAKQERRAWTFEMDLRPYSEHF